MRERERCILNKLYKHTQPKISIRFAFNARLILMPYQPI